MQIDKETITKTIIHCADYELQDALLFCNKENLVITKITPIRDGRSGRYVGEIVVIAEKGD